ncbi:hypothetical protein ACGF8B_40855 [Streptomyces sp. NPDC047917]|uniref:hypothetical protein n=1 Tax=Streptomyces sp. NPDC047917 TaxID=3365491 RepID=UPI0037167DFE
MRTPYHMAYRQELCEFVMSSEARRRIEAGRPVVSAIFVTPYPPGFPFPILVPSQEVSTDILDFTDALDTKEVHGLDPVRGYKVFTHSALVGDNGMGTGVAPQESDKN